MRYLFVFILMVAISCAPGSVSETATDSTSTIAVADDTVQLQTPPPQETASALSSYNGDYKLFSTSSAEQARMTLNYLGDSTYEYSIDWQMADFCSTQESGEFSIDENNRGEVADENRTITFSLVNGSVEMTDTTPPLNMGSCSFTGRFVSCNGECPAMTWEEVPLEERL